MCIGDFNVVLRGEEQMGPNERDVSHMRGFQEAIDLIGLDDRGYIGVDSKFEKKLRAIKVHIVWLDMAIAMASWSDMFFFASVRHLVVAKCDHRLIALCNELYSANKRITTTVSSDTKL